MKDFWKILAAALCALLVFASCDKELESNKNPDTPPEQEQPVIPDLVIPDILFEGYYYGDYYECGNGNAGINFIEGSIGVDYETEQYIGTGLIVCIDVNFALAENSDLATVPVGTYVPDEDYSCAPGTWGYDESYVLKVVDGEVIYEYASIEDGTLTVSEDPAGYKYVVDMVIEGGEELSFEYVGPARLKNSSEDENAQYSNLTEDVEVQDLTQASMFCVGDLMGDDMTETWAISIGDKYYDLLTDYGPGYSMLLYFNLEPGLSGVPARTYTDFIDPLTAESLEPDTLLGGMAMYGMYMGCYYMCPALTEEAALKSGSVTVAVENDIYTISGTLSDGYGNKVSFSYEGEVEMMQYEEYSVKSSTAGKGLIAKKPSLIKTK
ncbi:MAG: hypothetical protein IJ005_02410 [Bacteroidales bacterium]|nr:hypothetical protein [Bacteroidales bacterium]